MAFADLGEGHVRVYYEDTGDGHPPLLFSHGILMDHEMWALQVAHFSAEHRCITWDERGHGRTPSGGSFDYWDSARDALALLDHLRIERAVFVGMSQGGYLSLRAALLAPDRVAALCLIDSQATIEDPALRPGYDAMIRQWVTEGPSEEIGRIVASIIIGPGDHDEWVAKWTGRPKDSVVEPMRALFERDDLTGRLGAISCPALVLHGTDDAAIAMDRAAAVADELPGCDELVPIAGAGHAANLTHPDAVNEALARFLRSL